LNPNSFIESTFDFRSFTQFGHILSYRISLQLSSLPFLSTSDGLPSHSPSPPATTNETIRVRAEECQKIVDEAVSGLISSPAFLERLKGAGATPDEARDYIEQFTQRRRDREAGSADAGGVLPPDANNPNPVDTATSIAWALLRAKVNYFQLTSS
jgi:hypothetical protein